MKNGNYKCITEIGLDKAIVKKTFDAITALKKGMKKGLELAEPIALIFHGNKCKRIQNFEGVPKEFFIEFVKFSCFEDSAWACMIICEGFRWNGTEEEHNKVIKQMGTINYHEKSIEVFCITIEVDGKNIVGCTDIIKGKGNERKFGELEWAVVDAHNETNFSGFIQPQKAAA